MKATVLTDHHESTDMHPTDDGGLVWRFYALSDSPSLCAQAPSLMPQCHRPLRL